MQLKSQIKCPACGTTTPILFKKPKLSQPSVFQFHCLGKDCESLIMVKIEKPKSIEKMPPDQVKCSSKIIKPGPKLALKLLAEEEAKKAKEQKK